jgi:transcription termination/antitermination protein NusG
MTASEKNDQPLKAAAPDENAVPKRWFVVQTYSGFENKAKKSLEDKIKMEGLHDLFGEIMIPMEQVVEMRDGQKRQTKRKLLPSYVLVQMVMNDRTKHLVKNTPKVMGFLGAHGNDDPPPLSENQVRQFTNQLSDGALKPKPKVQYDVGDTVRVIDGPFANFNGNVEEVNAEKGRVKVLVSIFGRSTPLDLDFMQIEKTSG